MRSALDIFFLVTFGISILGSGILLLIYGQPIPTPVIIGAIAMIAMLLSLAIMGLLQIFKHRHDKERW